METTTNRMHLQSQWTDMKGRIVEAWGVLTDDDVTKAQGQWDRLVAIIRERTGDTLESIETKLDDMISSFDETASPRS